MAAKLTIIGSGNWLNDYAQPAFLLSDQTTHILVDCGAGTLSRLQALGISPLDIYAIFLTHFHWDHFGDVINFALTRWAHVWGGATTPQPLRIFGPPTLQTRFAALLEAGGAQKLLSQNLVELTEVTTRETDYSSEVVSLEPFTFQAFTVRHALDMVCYGWRVGMLGSKTAVAFSGDAGPNQAGTGFLACIDHTDMAVIEAGAGQPLDVHLLAEQSLAFAEKTNVRVPLLNHLDQALRQRAEEICQTNRAEYKGKFEKILLLNDGQQLPLS